MFDWQGKTYRKILDNMPDGAYLVDTNKKIQYWNRAAESLTGLTSTDVVGKTFDQINIGYVDEGGTPIEAFEYPAALCFQENTPINKNLFLKSGDSVIPVEESVTPIHEKDKTTGVIAIIKNIAQCIETVTAQFKAQKSERLIPICGWCKKIRQENEQWQKLEDFLVEDGFGVFTHGMCPSCADKIFEKKVYLESYQNICKAISSSITLEEVLQLIVTNVVKVMNVKASLLRLLNKETQQLEVA